MMGYNTCWVPGTDHASIATEAKVVAKLAKKGIQKSDLTREELEYILGTFSILNQELKVLTLEYFRKL